MFKRIRWTFFGAVAGVGGSMWAQRRVRRAVERYLPAQVSDEVRSRLGRAGDDLRAVVSDGRAALSAGRVAMAEREEELRARLPGPPPLESGTIVDTRGRIVDARGRIVERHREIAGGSGAGDDREESWERDPAAAPDLLDLTERPLPAVPARPPRRHLPRARRG